MKTAGKTYNQKRETFFSVLALCILLISLGAIMYKMLVSSIHYSVMHYALLAEGAFLAVILILYTSQHIKIKRINAEKDRALLQLENRMAAIEAAADGIGIVDADGALLYMNSALQKLHDISDDEVSQYIGSDWLNLYTENGRKEVQENVLPVLTKTRRWRGTSPIVRNNGDIVCAEMSLTLLPDNSMIGTARDISDQQRAAKEKMALEQQFYQAQKMEAIGRLAGGIAHDFNNILAAISGYAEFLEEDLAVGSAEQQFAKNILKAGAQAKELVDQMLAFSRQKQSTKDALNLLDPVKESLSMITASFPKSIEVHTDFDGDEFYIDGNSTQISQLLMNLCVNARDAMEEDRGGLSLTLESPKVIDSLPDELMGDKLLEPSETPNIFFEDVSPSKTRMYLGQIARDVEYVALRVCDSGTGMSRTIMEHIFEPFFTTKSVDKGTGLGLATVHGVVAGHCGALVIESEVGKGTCFHIYLPSIKTVSKRENIDVDAIADKVSGNILLVEDQEDVQEMMANMLERLGYDVGICSDGLEALAIIKDSPGYFDLVITDHNMPKMTGVELVQQVCYFDPDLPFIMVSGYSREKLQEIIKDHPSIKDVLRKPTPRKALNESIVRILMEKNIDKQKLA
ncbi:MAG: hypothetical protein CMH27_01440 [Micavibrio sp.]|nr:hypothetical protein [Micavibrio sp.]|tara:strand:- start:1629 stop:3512 length:1884 start_codon:yes stop_codon:yes gene_type:complete